MALDYSASKRYGGDAAFGFSYTLDFTGYPGQNVLMFVSNSNNTETPGSLVITDGDGTDITTLAGGSVTSTGSQTRIYGGGVIESYIVSIPTTYVAPRTLTISAAAWPNEAEHSVYVIDLGPNFTGIVETVSGTGEGYDHPTASDYTIAKAAKTNVNNDIVLVIMQDDVEQGDANGTGPNSEFEYLDRFTQDPNAVANPDHHMNVYVAQTAIPGNNIVYNSSLPGLAFVALAVEVADNAGGTSSIDGPAGPPNNPPTEDNPHPDVTFFNDRTSQLDIRNIFSDSDGELLNITLDTFPDFVSETATLGLYDIIPRGTNDDGTYTFTPSATDDDGATTQGTPFTATITSPQPNITLSKNTIQRGETISATGAEFNGTAFTSSKNRTASTVSVFTNVAGRRQFLTLSNIQGDTTSTPTFDITFTDTDSMAYGTHTLFFNDNTGTDRTVGQITLDSAPGENIVLTSTDGEDVQSFSGDPVVVGDYFEARTLVSSPDGYPIELLPEGEVKLEYSGTPPNDQVYDVRIVKANGLIGNWATMTRTVDGGGVTPPATETDSANGGCIISLVNMIHKGIF